MTIQLFPATLFRLLPWQVLLLLGLLLVAHDTRAQQLYALDTSAANHGGQSAAAEAVAIQSLAFCRPAGAVADDSISTTVPVPVPVVLTEMVVLRSAYDAPGVMLRWTTASERCNSGFVIERRTENETVFHRVAQVPGQGNSTDTHRYAFADDENREPKITYYRLCQLDSEGLPSTYSPEYAVVGLPLGLPVPEVEAAGTQSE